MPRAGICKQQFATVVPNLAVEVLSEGNTRAEMERAAGISRKQVARLLESEGITREPSPRASARLPEILELRGQGTASQLWSAGTRCAGLFGTATGTGVTE